jgi:FtsZ-binding cell division protein ZapB
MANCKVCNKRIDFDELDRSEKIGETIQEVDDKIIQIPQYGKFPYIRRGRWYWHVGCYPDKLPIKTDKKASSDLQVLKIEFNNLKEENSELKTQLGSATKTIDLTKGSTQSLMDENANLKKDMASIITAGKTMSDANAELNTENSQLKKKLEDYEKLREQLKSLGITEE